MQTEQGWAAGASPEQLALVRADLDSLSGWLQDSFWPSLQNLLDFAPAQVRLVYAKRRAAEGLLAPCQVNICRGAKAWTEALGSSQHGTVI